MTLAKGSEAPDFELEKALSGESWSLTRALKTGPALIVFVKSSCPTCRWCLPLVERLYRNYPRAEASIAVLSQDTPRAAGAVLEELKLTVPVLAEKDPYPVSSAYQVKFVPTFYWITPQAQIEIAIESFVGSQFEELNRRMADLASLSPVSLQEAGVSLPEFRPG